MFPPASGPLPHLVTLAEQLTSVQTAIAAIEGGAQSYEITSPAGSTRVTRADLATLYARETKLKAQIRQASGGIRVRFGVPFP